MKAPGFMACWLILLLLAAGSPAHAREMRQLQLEARATRQALEQKAAAEKRAAETAAAESRARILADRNSLRREMDNLEGQTGRLDETISALTAEAEALAQKEKEANGKLAQTDSMIRELVGVVRINAKDMDTLISQNLQSAFLKEDTGFLGAIAAQSTFPDMETLRRMAALLEEAIRSSGEVSVRKGPVVDRSGGVTEAEILAIGNFTAAYRTDEEAGYLSYLPGSRRLFSLSKLPTARMQKQISAYMDGKSKSVPMDISRGGALHQLTHALSLWEQIHKGGPIVWPILAILALGVLIGIERGVFLLRRRVNTDGLVSRIEQLAGEGRYEDCEASCAGLGGKPVARVLHAGLKCCRMQREEMENALQEAILRETPSMDRFLSTLGLLAAIAPLLGLLGTVTGMIDVFHVITSHGTGDPRMMSGGISEALVTTMLGLSVAIPIMLVHTLLSRTVENRMGQMEEKAVALVNIVDRYRSRLDPDH